MDEGPAAETGGRVFVFPGGLLSPAGLGRQSSLMMPPATVLSANVPVRHAVLAVLRSHRERLAAMYGVRDLLLFGSMARGEATETSDVDLIVEFDPNRITLPTFLDFTDVLEALLGRRVDVISLKKLTPRLRAQVEAEAVRVA